MKNVTLFIAGWLTSFCCYAQSKDSVTKLDAEQTRAIMKQILPDSAKLLQESSEQVCKCIDSIKMIVGKGKNDYSVEIKECIDKQVSSYQLSLLLLNSLKGGSDKLELNVNKNSAVYIGLYRDIERFLRDSCTALRKVLFTNDKTTDKSLSENKEALKEYNKGIKLLKDENYSEAIVYFENATAIDPGFAFAWDNVGICARRLGDYNKAIEAYKKSIAVDPEGITPLQNLPVAYEFLKKYDEAIEAYHNFLKISPDDPEAYYGSGRIYIIYKKDFEKGLEDMCMAYNLYTKSNSAYRVDAEKIISVVYKEMKKQDKLDVFNRILKAHHISTE